MLTLLNLADYSPVIEGNRHSPEQLSAFLQKYRLDGVELIQHNRFMPWDPQRIPAKQIKGLHMQFWPTWLDFWKGDMEEVLRQFGTKEACREYYGGETREALVEYYRKEIATARKIGIKYIVFHVSHVQVEHCFSYQFSYSDEEVADAFIQMLNEVLEGVEAEFDLLLENQWWPGLTLLDRQIAHKLLRGIRYSRTGFVLDIGHMMNTNLQLKSEEEAVEYILETLHRLADMAPFIKGIHLNSSLSGEYVKKVIKKGRPLEAGEFFERYNEACWHIAEIDRHKPFLHASIQQVIRHVKPSYLVYEFRADSLQDLEHYIKLQNDVLNGW